jgi:IS605 OrfB family transposase
MKIISTYGVKIKTYNHIFKETVEVYRHATDFLIQVCLNEWEQISPLKGQNRLTYVEALIHVTDRHPDVKYTKFDKQFYKLPSYLRRSAINEATGKVSSYKSNLANWENEDLKNRGRKPSFPKAGYIYPCMYRGNMYQRIGTYEAKIKVYIRNTWDWLTVKLRKSDVDYIEHRCATRKKCAPTLQKRGHEWHLDFPFMEEVELCNTDIQEQTIVAVDLGINTAATVSVMRSDGTILGRHFCKLSEETDRLTHSVNRIKKAQQHGNRKIPRLWAKVKGINHDISVKTAEFIVDIAVLYNADTIVFEHLNRKGKVHGSKKQRLKLWRSQEVQAMVTNKAHRLGMHISRICAWGTSRFAYDGSGTVLRGSKADFPTYELCRFQNGKVYNCDLSASYNIGARYFIREILKSLDESSRLLMEAKVPSCSKRSTCTWSTLINLNAELMSLAS